MALNQVHTKPLWDATTHETVEYPSLAEDMRVDVAIIGAGITGISAAYNLSRQGKNVVVLESGQVGMGTTGSSTGNLYVPTGQFHKILSRHGEDVLLDVVLSRAAALTFIEDRIEEFGINCGFVRVPWNYFATTRKSSKEIEKEFETVKKSGLNARDTPLPGFPFGLSSLVCVEMQAQFNPLQYVKQLAESIISDNCRIFEDTRVINIHEYDPCYVETAGGTVKADKVIQATHTPKGVYMVHAQMEVFREYAVAVRLKENYPPPGIFWALDGKDKYSIRTYSDMTGDFLIVLGDTRKTGHKKLTEESFAKVFDFIKRHFLVEEISYLWAAQNYTPADYLPYIGTSPLEANVYIATGFSADGLIYGTAAANIISDLILERHNAWAKTFDPKRFNPKASAAKTLKENVNVTTHLVKEYIFNASTEDLGGLKHDEGKIVELTNDKAAAYMDTEGHLHLVSAKCPHMGCIVQWNSGEKSWDCPCHGSRFTVDGTFIEGPAFGDLTKYKISGA
jgi:glycine/D-amino acid oxidase-like deaminating enzyme/nitrite reductase/ring-hydroxylating ferredoxin subunit